MFETYFFWIEYKTQPYMSLNAIYLHAPSNQIGANDRFFLFPWTYFTNRDHLNKHLICGMYSNYNHIKTPGAITHTGPKFNDNYCQTANYIFILDLTPGFNGLGKDNCKTRRELSRFYELVRRILEMLR